MKGSHAPSLRTLVRRALREEAGLRPGASILVACSGGPDSIALLHVLAGLREACGLELRACGVDHGLRAEAAAELTVASELAASLSVPFEVRSIRVAPGPNLMARAREARFAELRSEAAGHRIAMIATGHHADDRAETVVMRLLRGAGPRGLGVLACLEGDLLRPLIRARRADVSLHLQRHGLDAANDPTNGDARFLRTRVRHEVMPLLEQLSPAIVENLSSLADALHLQPVEPAPLDRLGRRQRQAVARAEQQGKKSVRVRVSDSEEVLVCLDEPWKSLTESLSPRRRGREPTKS